MMKSLLSIVLLGCLAAAPLHAQTFPGEPIGDVIPPGWVLPPRAAKVAPNTKVALLAAKILTAAENGPQVIDRGVLVIDGRTIRAIGKQGEVEIPEGFTVMDLGDQWLMPGMVELHAHVAGTFDINDTVFLTNPGLRVSTAVVPENSNLVRAVAGGVTSMLFIPGSGSNMGGQGVLLKTALPHYEQMEVRNPGSLKLAQAGNPERFAWGVNRSFMNWNTRDTFERGIAYANEWIAFGDGKGPKPEVNLQFEVFRWLVPKIAQVSTHTQIYQVVQESLEVVVKELKMPLFIDHGTIGGWKTGEMVRDLGVAAIIGPRNVDTPMSWFIGWAQNMHHEGFRGVVAGYQERGVTQLGFNTDSPVVPQEELQYQASMAVRFGMVDDALQTVRGLTIIPARTANINDRVGSLEVGKEADILVITGHPADPRSSVERVWIEGSQVYNAEDKRVY